MEIGKVVMIMGNEYKVSFLNTKKGRIILEALEPEYVGDFEVNEKIIIENKWYIIHFFHNTKKRLTIVPLGEQNGRRSETNDKRIQHKERGESEGEGENTESTSDSTTTN